MHALMYNAPDQTKSPDAPKPTLRLASDVLIKLSHATRSGNSLQAVRNDKTVSQPGSILQHMGLGVVAALGPGRTNFKAGDRVLISRMIACGHCASCRQGMYAYCEVGGWILSSRNQGETEFVWMPYGDDEAMVILSDIQPGDFSQGMQEGKTQLSEDVAIIGAGPIGLAAMLERCAARIARQVD